MQAFLISFANLSLLAFQCFDHFDGASTLIQYPQQFCYENDHSFFILLSMLMVLTVILPFNVFFMSAILKGYAIRNDESSSIRHLVKYKIFFQRWRPERWYWGYVFTWRQMLLALVFSVSNEPSVQLFLVLVLLNVYNMVLATLRPWRSSELNMLEFMLNFVFVALLLSQFPDIDPGVDTSLFRNLSVVLLFLYICVLCLGAFRVCVAMAMVRSSR